MISMKMFRIFLGVLFALSAHGAAAEKPRKVLVIGIDGCRPDALAKAKTPVIDALAKNGAYSYTPQILPLRIVDAETSSGPGWASMLSGAFPDKHGWIDDVRRRRFNGRFPHFFARLKKHDKKLSTASIITWPDMKLMITGADINETSRSDEAAEKRGIEVLTKQQPDAVFIHLDEVDGAGHSKGFDPGVPEYIGAMEKADARVGRIIKALRSRSTYDKEDWLVIVSSDHGGHGNGHNSHRHVVPAIRKVFLIVSGESAKRGKIEGQAYTVDVAVTALAHMGVKIDPKWKLDGVPVGLKGHPTPAKSRPNEPAATKFIRRK